MFKNMRVYRIPQHWTMSPDAVAEALQTQAFKPLGEFEVSTDGWVPPRHDGLVHTVNKQMLLKLRSEKKSLPYNAVKEAVKVRAKEVSEAQGSNPGRKAMKDIKEQVIDEMLPKAFVEATETAVWLDPIHGWLVIDTPSPSRSDLVVKTLIRSFAKLPLETLYVAKSIGQTMTDWLAVDEAPAGFTVDQDAELRSRAEDKATVKYTRQTLRAEDLQVHIAQGKACTKLAMTWEDKISFVLHDTMAIRRIKPLDVLNEEASKRDTEEDVFDGDFALMTGEFNGLLSALIEAFGGERPSPMAEDDKTDLLA